MSRVKEKLRVLVAAGGTGGHVFPGVAVAEELKAASPGAQIMFAGTSRGLEAKILPQEGWPLILMGSSSIKDRKGIAKLAAWARLPFSIARAMLILVAEKPHVLVSIGGYAAGPLSVAAWIMRIPVLLVEPNAIPGMTNLKLGRFARRVCVAFDEAARRFEPGKALLTGVPVRRKVLEVRAASPEGLGRTSIFLFGGSQGAVHLNRAMMDALPHLKDLRGRMRVIHQTGTNDDTGAIADAYGAAGIDAKVFAFTDRIWECYAEANIVIGRSGANTVAEVAALGLPSILVPYPYAADDHQRANAEWLARLGGAAMILNGECNGERLASELRMMIADGGKMDEMATMAAKAGRPDAAKRIAQECMRLAGR
ncbi:MAG: undecaprenyldiphospho-muramoylpentapeptide beta-N-acetylglucosaminyltransferase [bacterium]